jgi:hypothetical protein
VGDDGKGKRRRKLKVPDGKGNKSQKKKVCVASTRSARALYKNCVTTPTHTLCDGSFIQVAIHQHMDPLQAEAQVRWAAKLLML